MTESMTVLIPTHGRPTLLGRSLASLATCRLLEGDRLAVAFEYGSRVAANLKAALAVGNAHADYRVKINKRLPEVKARSESVFLRTVSLA